MTLISVPANPVPDGATSGMLKTPDGVDIRYAHWAPPPGRKGTICLFQGRAEFVEKYFELARDLHSRGFAVLTFDFRGQGLSQRALSDPFKGHVRNFSEYETDVETVVNQIMLPDCPAPYFALGHSMGAAVMLRMAYRGMRWFDRMMILTPMIKIAERPYLGIARPTVKLLRSLGMGGTYIPGGDGTVVATRPFIGNPLTSDPVRYARTAAVLEAEPGLGIGSPTVAWTDAAFQTMRHFADPSYIAKIRLPALIVAAGKDQVVSTPAIEDFAIRLRAGAHLIVAGARHEMLMEQDRYRSQVLAAFDAFIPGTPAYA